MFVGHFDVTALRDTKTRVFSRLVRRFLFLSIWWVKRLLRHWLHRLLLVLHHRNLRRNYFGHNLRGSLLIFSLLHKRVFCLLF
jgi:hypothetical protein